MRVSDANFGNTQPSGQGLAPEQIQTNPGDFGAQVGNAISGLAQTVDNFSTLLQQKQQQAQKFAALQALDQYQQTVGDQVTQMSRQYDPAKGATFTQDTDGFLTDQKNKFLATLPPELQPEFAERVQAVNLNLHQSANKYQLDAMDQYAKDGLSTSYNSALDSLDQDGSKANLDLQRGTLDDQLNNSGLSVAEQTALRRQYYIGMESVSYKNQVMQDTTKLNALGVGPVAGNAITLVQQFQPNLTDDQASTVVKSGAAVIASQVPATTWAAQSDPVKAALISATTLPNGNTTALPAAAITALKNGDTQGLATAIQEMGGKQHQAEADVITGKALLPPAHLDADPRYQDIPYEDRLSIRKDAQTELTAQNVAQTNADKAQHNAIVNSMEVAAMNGGAGQADLEAAVQAGTLTDYDEINKIQDIINKYQGDTILAQRGQQMLASNMTFDPTNADTNKIENAMVGQAGMNALQGQDKDYASNTLVPMVKQMQDIPTNVVGVLKGMIRSPDPLKSMYAYDLLGQLQQAAPKAYDASVQGSDARDVAIYNIGKNYYDSNTLMQILQGGDTQEQRTRTAGLIEDAHKILDSDADKSSSHPITGDVLSQLGVGSVVGGIPFVPFTGQTVQQSAAPWAANAAMADFNTLFQISYSKLGNIDAAKQAAIQLLKKDWQVSTVGGQPVLMKNAPEKFYPTIDNGYDWMTQQGNQDLKLAPGETFQLIADSQTDREVNAMRTASPLDPTGKTWGPPPPPSYLPIIVGADGTYRTLPAGEPNRIQFSTQPLQAQMAADFDKKRAQQDYNYASQKLQEASAHAKATGIPIPPDVLHDLITDMLEGTP